MKHIPKSHAKKVNVGAGDVLEYGLDDPDIDIAVATINGNYPNRGFVVNKEVKEILYVISGSGKLVTKGSLVNLNPGDQALINKRELFRYADCTNLVVAAACAPAWTPDQHEEVN
jgi:mannose-6-phosphate isomerase-like protein (cupin superfamily)